MTASQIYTVEDILEMEFTDEGGGHVYFIQQGEDGPIKIGFSTDVEGRLKSLQTATPYPLVLLGVMEGNITTEARLHGLFQFCRLSGEWFEPRDVLLQFIRDQAVPLETTISEKSEEATTFNRWLSRKVTENSPRGDVANDWIRDVGKPSSNDIRTIVKYLNEVEGPELAAELVIDYALYVLGCNGIGAKHARNAVKKFRWEDSQCFDCIWWVGSPIYCAANATGHKAVAGYLEEFMYNRAVCPEWRRSDGV